METRPSDSGEPPEGCPLTKLEIQAVKSHQKHLRQKSGREVDFDMALVDWLDNCALAWREERMRLCNERQREEILRHKWIESEKADRDLGKEAVMDWIHKHAAEWRAWYEGLGDDDEAFS